MAVLLPAVGRWTDLRDFCLISGGMGLVFALVSGIASLRRYWSDTPSRRALRKIAEEHEAGQR